VFDSSGYGAAEGAGAQTMSAAEVVIAPEGNSFRYAAPTLRAGAVSPKQSVVGLGARGFGTTFCGVRFEYRRMLVTLWESVC
jgi:hypothetical protein